MSDQRGADYQIRNAGQAEQWIKELIDDVEQAREDCTLAFPGDEARTVRWQKRAYHRFMVKHGAALGALMAMHRTRYIGDKAYHDLKSRVLSTLAARVIGEVVSNIR